MRLATVATVVAALTLALPAAADAEVVNCGAYENLGALTCTTTGPAMIDGTEFVGDGSSAAQWQWVGSTTVDQAGTLRLSYTYTEIYNTLFAKIGIRLTVSQPTCDEGYESRRNWVDPATMDGVPAEVSVAVGCPGRVAYRITSRAATYSTGGSYIGRLSEANLSFAGSHEATSSRLASYWGTANLGRIGAAPPRADSRAMTFRPAARWQGGRLTKLGHPPIFGPASTLGVLLPCC